jgi:DNA-binding response OmpR family regulator
VRNLGLTEPRRESMKPRRVLLVDNYAEGLNSLAEIMERAGYRVTRAGSYEDGEKALSDLYFHVAILDLRLRDNDDIRDISGLELAKQSSPLIPKIIFTMFPTFETSRDSLVLNALGQRPAVSFVSKKEPLPVLFEQIERAIKSLQIRSDLVVEWNVIDRRSLLERLTPDAVERDLLDDRIDELDDLITQLFPEAKELRFERLLWQDGQRAAVLARALFAGGVAKYSVILVGLSEAVSREAEKFRALDLDISWPGVPSLERVNVSARFSAILMIFGGVDLLHSRPLADVFHHGPERLLVANMQYLLEDVLPSWYRTPSHGSENLDLAYANRAQVPIRVELFEEAVGAVEDRLAGLGLKLKMKVSSLHVRIRGRDYVLPDPCRVFRNLGATTSTPLCLLPGRIDGQNILADDRGRVGLTNFSEAGGGPLLAPLQELEAAVRFDSSEDLDLEHFHEANQLLAQDNFSNIQVNEASPTARKTLKVVLQIRRSAEKLLNGEYWRWHFGLLFEILLRIETRGNRSGTDSAELVRCVGLILAAGFTAQAAAKGPRTPGAESARQGLGLDVNARAALINGVSVVLTAQSFGLLRCLYERRETVCGPEVLVLQGLGENRYDQNDESQATRLATAIRRLREKIEPNPSSPKFLCREGGGYVLHRGHEE